MYVTIHCIISRNFTAFTAVDHEALITTLQPTADVILVFIMGLPVITKMGDYSTLDIPIVADNLSKQLWKC